MATLSVSSALPNFEAASFAEAEWTKQEVRTGVSGIFTEQKIAKYVMRYCNVIGLHCTVRATGHCLYTQFTRPLHAEVYLACETRLYAACSLTSHTLMRVACETMQHDVDHKASPPSQTSIMAVEYDGGVVIGADTRTSSGYVFYNYTCTM